MQTRQGDSIQLNGLQLDMLLPENKNDAEFFRYEGSLTTPDCNEVVTWTVFREPKSMSEKQLEVFRKTKLKDNTPMVNNFRKLQPLNSRTITTNLEPVVEITNSNGPGPKVSINLIAITLVLLSLYNSI